MKLAKLFQDVPLNYRASNEGVALDIPDAWDETLFGPVKNSLPGSNGPWTPLTYPRFEYLDNGDLLFECRIGAYVPLQARSSCRL